jgi:hypothetical protein
MLGKIFLSITALAQILGPFVADFNHTHVLNPRWPPHARFHNGQTMSMGVGLGLLTLYYTFRNPPFFITPSATNAEKIRFKSDSLFTAALIGSIYWITGLSAVLYPGSKAVDPEFGEGFPQFWMFVGFGASAWAGWWVEAKNLELERKVLEGRG